jgi:hypothetical protein
MASRKPRCATSPRVRQRRSDRRPRWVTPLRPTVSLLHEFAGGVAQPVERRFHKPGPPQVRLLPPPPAFAREASEGRRAGAQRAKAGTLSARYGSASQFQSSVAGPVLRGPLPRARAGGGQKCGRRSAARAPRRRRGRHGFESHRPLHHFAPVAQPDQSAWLRPRRLGVRLLPGAPIRAYGFSGIKRSRPSVFGTLCSYRSRTMTRIAPRVCSEIVEYGSPRQGRSTLRVG